MNKAFLIFILFISNFFFSQEGIQFDKSTFSELLAKAKKENKLIFLDAMASWCGPCKMMEKNIFTKKEVGDFYNRTFINTSFDMENGEGREIALKYGVRSYPTYLFINGDGQLISQNMGYMSEKVFLDLGKQASSAQNKFGALRERFEKGESDPEFLISIIKLHGTSDYEFAKKASERYFKNKKDSVFTKEETSYLLGFIKSVEDPNFKIFIENRKALHGYYPEEAYSQFENNLRMQKVIDLSIDEKNQTIKEEYFIKNAIPLIGEEVARIALYRLKMNYYDQTGKFPEYEKTVIEYFENPDEIEPKDLSTAAKRFSEKATDPASLKKAEIWAEKAVMRGENAENTLALAKLYLMNGKRREAKLYAESSLKLHQKKHLNTKEVDQLLNEIN